MEQLVYRNNVYRTEQATGSGLATMWPTLNFYSRLIMVMLKAGAQARYFTYDGMAWSRDSLIVLRALEKVGVSLEVRGIQAVKQLEGPCVFVANHMSMLETMVLPILIQPVKDVTFVVKQSLLEYPVFKYIMRSRDPIAVSRKHPVKDLKAVLEGGLERIQAGRSIIVFPQTTRMASIELSLFNKIGIKLAKRAGVPVIPIALLTDAWGNGKRLKDFGKIDPSKAVFFIFGEPVEIRGRGDEEHAHIVEFIRGTVEALQKTS